MTSTFPSQLPNTHFKKMAPYDRLNQVNEHLNYPAGLLAGQVAIITGAGQGIGAEAARLFANEGAKVVVADIDSSKNPSNIFPSTGII
jgi:S-adenosylhomocysteine hydrolase